MLMLFPYKKVNIVCNTILKNTLFIRTYGTGIKQPKNIIEKSTSVNYFRNHNKNNLECGTTGNTGQFSNKGLQKSKMLTLNEKQKLSDSSFINYIWNNYLPGTPMYRIYVLERLNISVQFKRWQLLQYLQDNADTNSKNILNNIVVENIEGNADANFIIEVRAAFCFSAPFFKQKNNQVIFEELRLIHSTIEHSEERSLSIHHCGQANCDLLFKYKINHEPHTIILPLDIKHKVLTESDFIFNRLKVLYNEPHIAEFSQYSLDNQMSYVNNVIKTLRDTKEIPAIVFANKLEDALLNHVEVSDIIFNIQKFILLHPKQQYSKMSILLTEKTSISEEHFQNISRIPTKYASKITQKTFTKENYKPTIDSFANDLENKSYLEDFKQNVLENSLNTINSWKFSTPNNTNLSDISHD